MMAGATTHRRRSRRRPDSRPQEATVNRQGPIAGITGDTAALVEAAIDAHGRRASRDRSSVGRRRGGVPGGRAEEGHAGGARRRTARTYVDTLRQQQARSLRAVAARSACARTSKIEVNDELLTRPDARSSRQALSVSGEVIAAEVG